MEVRLFARRAAWRASLLLEEDRAVVGLEPEFEVVDKARLWGRLGAAEVLLVVVPEVVGREEAEKVWLRERGGAFEAVRLWVRVVGLLLIVGVLERCVLEVVDLL